MHYIFHRINTIKQLSELPHEYGVELDLRDRGDRLILQHDPFQESAMRQTLDQSREQLDRYLESRKGSDEVSSWHA